MSHGEEAFQVAALEAVKAVEAAAEAERVLEEAGSHRPVCVRRSSRLRGLSAGAILSCHGGRAAADILSEAREGPFTGGDCSLVLSHWSSSTEPTCCTSWPEKTGCE